MGTVSYLSEETKGRGLAARLGFIDNDSLMDASEDAPGFEDDEECFKWFICQTPNNGKWAIWSDDDRDEELRVDQPDTRLLQTKKDAQEFARYINILNHYDYECGDAGNIVEWAGEWFSYFPSTEDGEAWLEIGMCEARLAFRATKKGYTPDEVEQMALKKLPSGHLYNQNLTSQDVLYDYCYRDGPPPWSDEE